MRYRRDRRCAGDGSGLGAPRRRDTAIVARPGWSTVETADVATHLRSRPDTATLVDDLGGWLTAALDRRGWDDGSIGAMTSTISSQRSAHSVPRWRW